MSNVWIQFIVFAVALLFFCWLLLEYCFYLKEDSTWRQRQHLRCLISGKR